MSSMLLELQNGHRVTGGMLSVATVQEMIYNISVFEHQRYKSVRWYISYLSTGQIWYELFIAWEPMHISCIAVEKDR